MNKTTSIAVLATVAALAFVPSVAFAAEAPESVQASAQGGSAATATVGRMLYGSDGKRIASIYRVTAEGAAQLILDGRLVTVPASTLVEANGKLATSLTKSQLRR